MLPLPQPRDLFLLGYLPAMACIAWLFPESSWPPICSAAAFSASRRQQRRADSRLVARPLAGRSSPAAAARIARALAANHHLARLQMLRCHLAGSWRPRLTLVGREHVHDALRAGSGGILWVTPFVFSDLVTKMAFHQAGFRVTHLSRAEHGLSPSRFGVRFLNPMWTTVERRYLAERLVMAPEHSTGALRELIRRVKENQIVSVTVGLEGQRRRATPFLGGTLRVADGAPALAHRTGAALLPVFTIRAGDGGFVTTVEAPAQIASALGADEAVQRAVAHCAGLLESYALRWPDQYAGWGLTTATDSSASGGS